MLIVRRSTLAYEAFATLRFMDDIIPFATERRSFKNQTLTGALSCLKSFIPWALMWNSMMTMRIEIILEILPDVQKGSCRI